MRPDSAGSAVSDTRAGRGQRTTRHVRKGDRAVPRPCSRARRRAGHGGGPAHWSRLVGDVAWEGGQRVDMAAVVQRVVPRRMNPAASGRPSIPEYGGSPASCGCPRSGDPSGTLGSAAAQCSQQDPGSISVLRGSASPKTLMISAATPAACGAAIDVPCRCSTCRPTPAGVGLTARQHGASDSQSRARAERLARCRVHEEVAPVGHLGDAAP